MPGEKMSSILLVVLQEKIYLLPFHIKLGLMKNFVKGWIKPAANSNM